MEQKEQFVTHRREDGSYQLLKEHLEGVARLAAGMNIDEAIARLKGIQCSGGTSCPDQLAIALMRIKDGTATIAG